MTQNLRITGTISAADSNFEGEDFNVSEYDLKSNGTECGKCFESRNDGGCRMACARVPDPADLSTIGGVGATDASVGVWYNYYAATAGTVSGTSNASSAVYDICPSGWHLPSGPNTNVGSDFNRLVGNTNGPQEPTIGLLAFDAVTGGWYNNGKLFNVEYGFWWSSTADSRNRYVLLNNNYKKFYSSSWTRLAGLFVRCVRSS